MNDEETAGLILELFHMELSATGATYGRNIIVGQWVICSR